MQDTRRGRARDRTAEPCLRAQLDAISDETRPERPGVVLAAVEPDATELRRAGGEQRDLLGTQLPRGRDARIGVERGPDQRDRAGIERGIAIDAEPERTRGRPRLIALHEDPRVVTGGARVPDEPDRVEGDGLGAAGADRPLQLISVTADLDDDRADLVDARRGDRPLHRRVPGDPDPDAQTR